MLGVVVDLAAGEPDRLHERVSCRFARAEPRARVRRYVPGLVAGLERKNGWTLAERTHQITNPRHARKTAVRGQSNRGM